MKDVLNSLGACTFAAAKCFKVSEEVRFDNETHTQQFSKLLTK